MLAVIRDSARTDGKRPTAERASFQQHAGRTASMDVPAVRGVIDRRILANYRIDPDALDAVLPAPFEPWTVDGYGVGGICLIRMTEMRPPGVPAAFGMRSENAAHRIAVEWDAGDGGEGERRRGVYVPRRDTDSWLQVLFGSRLFSGRYSHASFETEEDGDRYAVEMTSDDGEANVAVDGRVADELPADSVFPDRHAASEFFRRGSLGYAPADPDAGSGGAGDSDATDGERTYEGVELDTESWNVEPLAVDSVHSGFFEGERFADDAVAFDCALLMRDIHHAWRQRESICAPSTRD